MIPLTDAELDGLIERLLVNNIAAGLLPPDVNVAAASALRSLRSERDALKAVAWKYGKHLHVCTIWTSPTKFCSCEWAAIRSGLSGDALKPTERRDMETALELQRAWNQDCQAERDALRAECAELRRDAGRFRFLYNEDRGTITGVEAMVYNKYWNGEGGIKGWCEAIDSAMTAHIG